MLVDDSFSVQLGLDAQTLGLGPETYIKTY